MSHQFCTFHVGDLYLGIEVERVQEVLRDCDITPVPTAQPSVRGLINLRLGSIGLSLGDFDLKFRRGNSRSSTHAT